MSAEPILEGLGFHPDDAEMRALFDEEVDNLSRNGNGGAPTDSIELDVGTAKEICAEPDPPKEDRLIGDFVVKGNRILIGGGTGEGKTTLEMQMLGTMLHGGEFLGIEVAPVDGPVLVVDAEQGTRSIKRLLREAGLDQSDDLDYIRVPDGLSLDSNPAERVAIERQLEQGKYVAVDFEPLYKLHTGDSNDERHAVDLMRRFDEWRTRFHFALLLGCHTRKMPSGVVGTLTINDIFGSGAYTRGAEVVLGIQRVRNGYSRLYFFKDRDGSLEVGNRWGLLFDREHGFRRDPNDDKPSTEEQLAALRAADPTITQTQAAEAIGVSDRTIRKYWKSEDDGQESLLTDD